MKRNGKIGIMLAAPAMIGFMVFYIIPMGITIWNSISFGGRFTGLDNYRVTFHNYMFRLAVKNTVKFLITAIPCIMILSLLIALALEKQFVGNRFFRLAFLYPLMVPVASTVMVVQVFLEKKGILNSVLTQFGISAQDWTKSSWAFLILVLLYLWKNIGYNIILLLAGLAMIPAEYEEMARLDGAGKWMKFRYITFPLLCPMFLFTVLISVLNSFKCFREAFLIGGNTPHKSIYMIQHFINNNFNNLNYTRLSVASTAMFLATAVMIGGICAGWMCGREGERKHEKK